MNEGFEIIEGGEEEEEDDTHIIKRIIYWFFNQKDTIHLAYKHRRVIIQVIKCIYYFHKWYFFSDHSFLLA